MKHVKSIGSMLGLIAATALSTPALANVSGAIYTTLSDGSEVNFNIYADKGDVYLNGGPGKGAGTNAPGLRADGVPDGVYVFMVTSPDGRLLSTDNAECRQVLVTGGLVVGATGPACKHPNGSLQVGGAIAVQLLPYDDTPNPGGEYKAWLTPVTKYVCPLNVVTCEEGRNGFINSESKTDNFKVNSFAHEIDTRFMTARAIFSTIAQSRGSTRWARQTRSGRTTIRSASSCTKRMWRPPKSGRTTSRSPTSRVVRWVT